MLKIKEVNKISCKRKKRYLAILDSKTATPALNKNTLSKNTANPRSKAPGVKEAADPQGKKRLTPKLKKIKNLLALAHSIKANFLPEYSKIIAS